MPAVTLYKLPQVVNLTLPASSDGVSTLMNYPVNRSDFKIVRGVRTVLDIFVRDVDRKPVDLTGLTITVVIADDRIGVLYLEKAAIVQEPATNGRCRLIITPGEASEIPLGLLRYSVTITDEDSNTGILYTDRELSHGAMVEVIDGPIPGPADPITVVPDDFTIRDGAMWSGSLPGAATVGHTAGVHTIAAYLEDFTGTLTIQGSIEEQPIADGDWFDVDELEFEEETSTASHTFIGNLLWVRFKVVSTNGEITQILYRN